MRGLSSFRRWTAFFSVIFLIFLQQKGRRLRTMSARRCDACQVDWPALTWTDKFPKKGQDDRTATYEFATCPLCGSKTEYLDGTRPIPKAEARSLTAHARFKKFYALWDLARERRGDPSPDAIGRLEAKEIYELEQALLDKESDA